MEYLGIAAYLLRHNPYLSKVGGKPGWLDLKNLPRPADLQCPKCNNPMNFLCQVYAPREAGPAVFHRTVFLFICKSGDCSSPNSADNIIALRCQLQLAKEHQFYSPATGPPRNLCHICGCMAPKQCSQCKSAFYCSTSHQRLDWKSHKQICQGNAQVPQNSATPFLLPEFLLVNDIKKPESVFFKGDDSEEAEERRKQEISHPRFDLSNVPEKKSLYTATNDDHKILKFKKLMTDFPRGAVMYNRGGVPLLIAKPISKDMLTIPNCTMCGSKRAFEFQMLPTIINCLKDEALDWGTILVYTCSKSCDTKSNYVREHVVKQDVAAQLFVE